MSGHAPGSPVAAGGREDSSTVLVSEDIQTLIQPSFILAASPRYPSGPFALLVHVLQCLTGESDLTISKISTPSAGYESPLEYLCSLMDAGGIQLIPTVLA